MEEIIIAGYKLEDLKKQQAAIRKDASAVIAKHIEAGKAAVEHLLIEPDEESEIQIDYRMYADLAAQHFEVVELVAGISGVDFFLPFYEEYGRYDSDDIYSMRLENAEHLNDYWDDAVSKLYGLLESMESDSCNWHSSRC